MSFSNNHLASKTVQVHIRQVGFTGPMSPEFTLPLLWGIEVWCGVGSAHQAVWFPCPMSVQAVGFTLGGKEV